MFWGPNKKLFGGTAAAILLASTATAAAAQVLVVRATGPSAGAYRAGMKLAGNAKINLKANDTLVLLDKRGARTLRGPGSFTPNSAPQAAVRSAAVAAAPGAGARRARIGAVRGVDGEGPRSMWLVDIGKDGTICLADASRVTLWRADASRPGTLTLTHPVGGNSEKVEWARGQQTLEWPKEMPVADGGTYRLSWKGAPQPAEVKFRILPREPKEGDAEDAAALLIAHDCQAQLDQLIAATPADAQQAGTAG